jgi:hypothetical protein
MVWVWESFLDVQDMIQDLVVGGNGDCVPEDKYPDWIDTQLGWFVILVGNVRGCVSIEPVDYIV